MDSVLEETITSDGKLNAVFLDKQDGLCGSSKLQNCAKMPGNINF